MNDKMQRARDLARGTMERQRGGSIFAVTPQRSEDVLTEVFASLMNDAPQWTTSPPTKPGWYWVMDANTPIVVELYVTDDGTIDGANEWTKDGYSGPYAGPIEPPKMTEGK